METMKEIGDDLEVGTRIHWDEPTQSLYYVDIPQSTIYKYKPSSGLITKTKVGMEPLTFAFPAEGKDNHFIAGLGRKIILLKWDGVNNSATSWDLITEVDTQPENDKNRLNGGKVDPFGRLWAGTMGPQDKNGQTVPGRGSLYSVTKGKLKCHLNNIGISNGLAFNVEQKKMYYIDTLFAGVYQFDYDPETVEITNKKIVFRFEDHNIAGLPDGLTIDRDGNLWLTAIFGSTIIQIDPNTGTLLKKIEMPTSQPTSLSWGGKDLNNLYVTTAKIPVDSKIPALPAGCTFAMSNFGEIKGFPGDRYKI